MFTSSERILLFINIYTALMSAGKHQTVPAATCLSPALTGAHYLITHHPQVHQGFWQAVTELV